MGYVNFWNAFTGSSDDIWVSGPVVKLRSYSGRYAGAQHKVTLHYGDRDIELSVPRKQYEMLREGDMYGRNMKRGGLGYYYTWGIAWWK